MDRRYTRRLQEGFRHMASMNEKDYYAILGVSKEATAKEIQRAFQQKARKLHPDVNKEPDAEERFKEISEAYAVLSDEQKRARYDAMRSGNPYAGFGGAPGSPYAGGNPYAGGQPRGGAYYGGFGGFGGFPFGGMWGDAHGGRASEHAYNPEEGADVVVDIDLTAEEARAGARKGVKYRRYEPCGHCHGSGSVSSDHAHTCPSCGGTGAMGVDMSFLFGAGVFQMVCPECGGSGKVVNDPCPDCAGTGRSKVVSETVVEFPAGSHDGATVRLKGMGHAGTNGAASGDLIARARVAAERLEGKARQGFHIMGLATPFLALALYGGALSFFALICVAPLIYGLVLVLREFPQHRSLTWLKRGAAVFTSGFVNALFYVLIMAWFASCSTGFYYRPMGVW